jgi:uracil-DNA glycosylase
MQQASLDLFPLHGRESAAEVACELKRTCRDCRLSHFHPSNPGLVWSGSLDARVAVLADLPRRYDMRVGTPFAILDQEWARWLRRLGVPERDLFVTHLVQCGEPDVEQLDPGPFFRTYKPEIQRCMHQRTLRLLASLPNLEAMLLLGLEAVQALLGGKVGYKSHVGEWFGTDLLPGVAILCLEHPRDLEPGVSEKRGRIYEILQQFRDLYLRDRSMARVLRHAARARAAGEIPDLNQELPEL